MKFQYLLKILSSYNFLTRGSKRRMLICLLMLILKSTLIFAQLNPNFPPGSNFDLSAWKLQTLNENLAFTEINSTQLQAGHTSSFFYTDSTDGSMVFKVPSNGSTTPNSSYPRVELRQMSNGANWALTDQNGHFLTATCKVIIVADANPKLIIGQIHGSETESELLKLRWKGYQPGQCIIEARFQKNDSTRVEYGVTLASGLSLGDLISYAIIMQNGEITVTVNNVSASQTYTSEYYGTTDTYYFKAGNYFGYNGTNPVVFGQVQFYSLLLDSSLTNIEVQLLSSIKLYESREIITLDQNFPNPFNPATTISFILKNSEHVTVTIFNVLGQHVTTLFDEEATADLKYSISFDAKNIPGGVYFYSIQAGDYVQTKKMILMK